MKVGIIRCLKKVGLSIRVLLITMTVCYPLLSCGHEKKASSADEREYPEALFTLGEMASVELEMPEATWQAIITKASDKTYHECAVTIVVNYDCMTGLNEQNYYLREADGRISLIPWDYNLAWGGYPEDEEMEGEDLLEESETNRLPTDAGKRSKEETSKIVNFPIDTPFLADVSKRTFFMKLLANETHKARYYHYLSVLCNDYINGGELAKTIATIGNEIGEIAGTEANAFYTNGQFHKAGQTLRLVLERRAASVLGQIGGTIPATWEGQKAQPQKLIKSDDINLQELGGI